MNQRALIDVVCKAGLNSLAGEISALLGQDLKCSDIELGITSKQQLFNNPEREKTALSRMSLSGDREGNCYLMTTISAAVILGGTLIMLPQDIINEKAGSGKLDGELNDAFGEVANIIAGVMTQAFVDKYPKALRFVKKTVEELNPSKVDPGSDDPFPPGDYYCAGCKMSLGERALGKLEFIVPAALFDLAPAAPAEPAAAVKDNPEPTLSKPEQQQTAATTPEQPQAAAAAKKPKFADAKKLVDVVLKATIGQIGEEVGALLGQTLKCDDIQLLMTGKAELFSTHCLEKSILSEIMVSGERQGRGYLLTRLADAVVLGGTLIMLPDERIAEEKKAGRFDGEVADAFGEIANILAGSLTQTFLDRYPKQIRFVKTDSRTIVPTKIDPLSDQPFGEGSYYLASFAIHMDGQDLHRFLLVFPADIFDLETAAEQASSAPAVTLPAPGEWGGPLPESETPAAAVPGRSASGGASTITGTGPTGAPARPGTTQAGPPIVLIISEQKSAAEPFVEILSSAGHDCHVLNFQDEMKELFLRHQILGILLIMAQVGEKGFAAAIKLQAAGRPLPPLIFAGAEWTRSAVLRAVKYGARDILVIPATNNEIQDKVSQHFRKAS